jgi:hypothetical protein
VYLGGDFPGKALNCMRLILISTFSLKSSTDT